MQFTDEMGIATAEKLGVRLTHPERIVFADQGLSKAEMVAYYAAVADRMLPYLSDRPLSLVRRPPGRATASFFQRHESGGFPEAVKRVSITERDGKTEPYMFIDSLSGIIAAVQMSTMEFHIWGSHVGDIERPDRIVFDIDPDEGLDFAHVRHAALDIRDRLGAWGLQSFPMLTGGKGIHVIAP